MNLQDLFNEFEAAKRARYSKVFLDFEPKNSKEAKELKTRADNGGWNFNDEFLHLASPESISLLHQWYGLRSEFESLEGKLVHSAHRPFVVDQAHKLAEKWHDVLVAVLKEGRLTAIDIVLYDLTVDEMNAKISFVRNIPDMILRVMDGDVKVSENTEGGFNVE